MTSPLEIEVDRELARIVDIMPGVHRALSIIQDESQRVNSAMFLLSHFRLAKHRRPATIKGPVFKYGDRSRLQPIAWPHTVGAITHSNHRYALNITRGATSTFVAKMSRKSKKDIATIGEWLRHIEGLFSDEEPLRVTLPEGISYVSSRHAEARSEALDVSLDAVLEALPGKVVLVDRELNFVLKAIPEVHTTQAAGLLRLELVDDLGATTTLSVPIGMKLERVTDGGVDEWRPVEARVITVIREDDQIYMGMQLGKDALSERAVDDVSTWLNMARTGVTYTIGAVTYQDLNDADCVMRVGGISIDRVASLAAAEGGADFINYEVGVMIRVLMALCGGLSSSRVEELLYECVVCEFTDAAWCVPRPSFGSDRWAMMLGYFAVAQRYAFCEDGSVQPNTWISRSIVLPNLYVPPMAKVTLMYPRMWAQYLPFNHSSAILSAISAAHGRSRRAGEFYYWLDRQGYMAIPDAIDGALRFSTMEAAVELAASITKGTSAFPHFPVILLRTSRILVAVIGDQRYVTQFRVSNIVKERDLTMLSSIQSEEQLARHGYGLGLLDKNSGLYESQVIVSGSFIPETIRSSRTSVRQGIPTPARPSAAT